MKKVVIWFVCMLCFPVISLHAQHEHEEHKEQTEETSILLEEPEQQHAHSHKGYGFNIMVGTEGIGMGLTRALNNKFEVCFEIDHLYLNKHYEYKFHNEDLMLDTKINWGNLACKIEFFPFENFDFKVETGLTYHFKEKFTIKIRPKDDPIDFINDPPKFWEANIHGSIFAPFLGIGLGKSVPRKKVNAGIELGVYYHGKARIHIKSFDAHHEQIEETKVIKYNLTGYPLFPVINAKVSYRLSKG